MRDKVCCVCNTEFIITYSLSSYKYKVHDQEGHTQYCCSYRCWNKALKSDKYVLKRRDKIKHGE